MAQKRMPNGSPRSSVVKARLQPGTVERIDAIAARDGLSRSDALRAALKLWIEAKEKR